jgi:hypothetical protein
MCEEGRPTWTPRATCLVQDVGGAQKVVTHFSAFLIVQSDRDKRGETGRFGCGERDGTICGAVVEHHPVGDPDHRVPTKTPARSCPNGCANSMLLKKSLGSPPT